MAVHSTLRTGSLAHLSSDYSQLFPEEFKRAAMHQKVQKHYVVVVDCLRADSDTMLVCVISSRPRSTKDLLICDRRILSDCQQCELFLHEESYLGVGSIAYHGDSQQRMNVTSYINIGEAFPVPTRALTPRGFRQPWLIEPESMQLLWELTYGARRVWQKAENDLPMWLEIQPGHIMQFKDTIQGDKDDVEQLQEIRHKYGPNALFVVVFKSRYHKLLITPLMDVLDIMTLETEVLRDMLKAAEHELKIQEESVQKERVQEQQTQGEQVQAAHVQEAQTQQFLRISRSSGGKEIFEVGLKDVNEAAQKHESVHVWMLEKPRSSAFSGQHRLNGDTLKHLQFEVRRHINDEYGGYSWQQNI